ncbi:MAG: VanZ family protein, partial [Planctomycetota bacterium]
MNRWTLLALAQMALLFGVSSIPDDGRAGARRVLSLPPGVQNLLHVPAYSLLAWLWWRSFRARGSRPARAAAFGAALACGYGILDEAHQAFVPGRTASVTDALLDALGAAIVLA